ncbi:MAG: tRNA (guanosine(37)-N1)-methyltransferase TrmD [Blastocatellia bacterium]|nr:tRNA (guanosine(37)-N1)-methyltransferase TrmD [Blastocatellia bacterium]
MRFDLLTIFPEFFVGPFEFGIIRRAKQQGQVEVNIHDLRSFTTDKHHIVDDRPFGGDDGMVLKPEPLFRAVEALRKPDEQTAVVLLTPQGRVFQQSEAQRFAHNFTQMILICGRYEGVDERVAQHIVTDEISIGDYVLTGGEIPAMVLVDAITRLLPNVLGSATSAVNDSFSTGLLDFPQYTRPASFNGIDVPEILLSGHHANIAKWRRREALRKTLKMRPDLIQALLARAALTAEEQRWIEETQQEN